MHCIPIKQRSPTFLAPSTGSSSDGAIVGGGDGFVCQPNSAHVQINLCVCSLARHFCGPALAPQGESLAVPERHFTWWDNKVLKGSIFYF